MLKDGQTQIAAILSSSGTTGPSKGVSLSHAAILQRLTKILYTEKNTQKGNRRQL